MKPIIAIGDVHGLFLWTHIVQQMDKFRFVFLGDYLDPYTPIDPELLCSNLSAIIKLKKEYPEDVTLLIGNHDIHYIYDDAPRSSRYNPDIAEEARKLFTQDISLFQNAYQEGKTLFTHAGVSQEWFDGDFHGDVTKSIADQLNNPTEEQRRSLYRIGPLRGGRFGPFGGDFGGIYWADIDELTNPLHGFQQIVGHNRVRSPKVRIGQEGGKIVFCDCLWTDEYYQVELF